MAAVVGLWRVGDEGRGEGAFGRGAGVAGASRHGVAVRVVGEFIGGDEVGDMRQGGRMSAIPCMCDERKMSGATRSRPWAAFWWDFPVIFIMSPMAYSVHSSSDIFFFVGR